MLLFRKYHFSKDNGVITYIYIFCIYQCNAGQLSEMQFRVVELETVINTHGIGTFFCGGGDTGHQIHFPSKVQPVLTECVKSGSHLFSRWGCLRLRQNCHFLCYFLTSTGLKWHWDNFGPQDIRKIKLFRKERSRQQASTFFIHCRSFCSWSVLSCINPYRTNVENRVSS